VANLVSNAVADVDRERKSFVRYDPDAAMQTRSDLERRARSFGAEAKELMADPNVKELYDSGYGTDRYAGGLLHPSSWNDKSQEKAALQAFPRFASWDALRTALSSAARGASEATAALAKLPTQEEAQAVQTRISALDQKRADAPVVVLRNMWQQIASHILHGDGASITQQLAATPHAQPLARALGLSHQIQAFDAVGSTQLDRLERGIKSEIATLTTEMAQIRQKPPRGSVPHAAMQQRFSARSSSISSTINTVRQRTEVVHTYNNYSSNNSFWDYMFWSSVFGNEPFGHDHHHHEDPAVESPTVPAQSVFDGLSESLPAFDGADVAGNADDVAGGFASNFEWSTDGAEAGTDAGFVDDADDAGADDAVSGDAVDNNFDSGNTDDSSSVDRS
jgi:hypothetical protein